MSHFNRKGYTTVRIKNPGGITHHAVKEDSKLVGILKSRPRKAARAQKERVREYKKQLREAKKQIPLAERAKVRLQDL